ncbi:uncharacterized protein LOC116699543 isoform X2 [Etheostoma spectabile]|uniref:uncharacterized protein LOC116699543 isoform X2 n=1 Tax=Etheostoma spectabile TaxID=54343 RepID=UPI0013AF230C|nr:uncharacterized protein LOC116699543 isoform X2 [Etheostoma spectabile]
MFAVAGTGSSSVHVRVDGKDRVKLDAQMSHTFQRGDTAVGLRLNVSQSLLPSATELRVNLAANMTSDSVSLHGSYTQGHDALLAQVKGSLKDTRGLQLAVSGDLRHSMTNLAILPPVLGLDGVLGRSDTLIEGQLRVRVMETLYSAELRHQEDPGDSSNGEDEEGMMGKKFHMARDWLCVWLGAEHLCVNVSRRLGGRRTGEVYTRLSHSFNLFNAKGVPASSNAQVRWSQDGGRLSVLAELQAGPEHLKAEFNGGKTDQVTPRWEYFSRLQHQVKALLKRGVSSSIQAKAHYQLETEGLDTSLVLHMEHERMIDILFNIGSKKRTAMLVLSLWQQIKLFQEVIPSSLQMNCTGDATADRLSAQCYGNVAGCPVETVLPSQTSANISITHSGCSTNLSTVLQVEGEQKGSLSLHLTCHPYIGLKASVQHSIKPIQMLGFPAHGALILNVSTAHLPGFEVGLELGRCHFRGNLGKIKASQTEEEQSSYTVNVTNYCPALQGTVLPVSLALQALLSVVPCQLTISSSLRADSQDLTLELSHSCRPPRLSGTLTHSFLGLRIQGVPQIITVEATAHRDPEQAGALFIKAGTCYIKADRVVESKGRTQRLWALESKCPMLQSHLNGSVRQDLHDNWTAKVDTHVDGKRVFLRLNARAWPELSVEGELSHNLPALKGLPEHSRLRVTCRAGKTRYNTEALIQMEECTVGVRGAAMSQPGLQGSLVYHNNCTVIQEWGSPDKMQSSALLVVSPSLTESQVSLVIDDTELNTSAAFKKTKDTIGASLNLNHSVPLLKKLGLPLNAALTMNSGIHDNGSYYYLLHSSTGSQRLTQGMTVSKIPETVRVKIHFRHTVNYLKKLGVPGNNSIQVELGSVEGKALTLQSQFGGPQAGVRLKMTKEIRGTMWHSWPWLREQGLPLNIEGLCSIQGVFSQLESRAWLTVDGHKLLASGLNISVGDGHLALLLSYSPPASNQTGTQDSAQHSLDTTLTAQFKGPLRSAVVDVHCQYWRIRMVGDVGGWGAHGGSKEARVTLKYTVQGQTSPALQVEVWGRLTESQLRCSMAVNPELSSSLALIIQGHHLPHSKDLMVKVVHNIPRMLVYLPSQLNVRSQLNQSQSSVAGLVEVLSGRRRLLALGELAAIENGWRQVLELKHSYPQLKPLPRTVAVKTVYEARNWSYQVQHGAVWGSQELILSGFYSAPPTLEMGNQSLKVQINCIPRWTSLEVTLERSLYGRLDSVLVGWTRHGRLEQVRALSFWSRSEDTNETKLELKQPFSSALSQMSLHILSHSSQMEQRSSHHTHLSWDSTTVPVNVSIILKKQWQNNTNRGQACALFSTQQMAVSSVKGCVSVGQEGNSYSQNAELRWDNRSAKQSMKYQRGPRGMHSLQVNVGLDKVSPEPCPSHTLLTKIQTNLRDRLEHTVLLGLCPPQPTFSWSGSHRVNSGEKLFYTQSRLSVTGRPHQCSLTFALINSSTAQGSNMSLFSESRIGNWSVEVGSSALWWPQGSGLQMQARLDRSEKIWLNWTAEGQCFQTTAGYTNGSGPGLNEDVTVVACVGTNRSLRLDVQKRDNSRKPETLGSVSVGSANQRLMLRASGCLESLTAVEERIQYLSCQLQNKLLERINTLQYHLVEFKRQSRDSELLQELSALPLYVSHRAKALLEHRDGGLLALWQSGPLRRIVTNNLPRFLSLLQHASLLGQQELRRPLATLAGVYQDVKGQRLEALWREAVSLWTDQLVEVLPMLLENPQLRPLAQASVAMLSVALDVAGQHTYHWAETRLAMALSGVRKRLASVYKFSPSECLVVASVALPPLPWSRVSQAGLVEVLLEEWLLRPLLTLTSVRPTAELYRLKRKTMDSPFIHQALLVADQFVVTFDGHLYELPGSCPLLLAQDVGAESLFTLLHTSDFLLFKINNSTVTIQHNGQVTNCNSAVTYPFHSDDGVAVRRGSNIVQVSNQNGVSVSCELSLEVCSFTLDGWLHGRSTGLLGTNDNEAGNDFPLPDGSQAENLEEFFYSWQMKPECIKLPGVTEPSPKAATSPGTCDFLFSSPDSPLSSCFRVVDPRQFLLVCEVSSSRAPCRLASAFVHLCKQNYIPLEIPVQCLKV